MPTVSNPGLLGTASSSPPIPRATDRIPELDGLRGIAIGLILILHFFQNTLNPQAGVVPRYLAAATRLTWSGVDLFFVLSGFLIGGILLDARTAPNYYRVFYARRLFRIVPIYIVFLAAYAVLVYVLPLVSHADLSWLLDRPQPWYAYASFTQNFWMATSGKIGTGALAVTWSLAVEEQFYLTLPLLVRVLPLSRLFRFLLAGIFAAPLVRTLLFYSIPGSSIAAYVLMPCRADALLLGVLAAILLRDPEWRERITRARLFFALAFPVLLFGIAYFTKAAWFVYSPLMVSVGLTWLPFFYFCVLLFALTQRESWLSAVLRNPALCWLGAIAYGVYLFHQTILGAVLSFLGSGAPLIARLQDLPVFALALAVTLLFARLSWIYFERPLVHLGHSWKYDNASAPSGLCLSPRAESAGS